MDLGLKNKVIVVTGGASDVGNGIVRMLSEEGAVVAIAGGNREENRTLQNELVKYGGHLFPVDAELGEQAACEKAVGAIIQHYGRIEGLVNNSGVTDVAGLRSGNQERFMENLHMNLAHDYLMTHFAIPYLKISKGAIVNIILKKKETGQGTPSDYAAAYGGRNALTREWAVELLKYGIRVNALIISENSMPGPSEIAHAAAFLLSEKSSHTTGQLIHVGRGKVLVDKALADA